MRLFFKVYGLWLSAEEPIPGLTPLPLAPQTDVDVFLRVMPSWLAGVLDEALVRYVSAYTDEHGQPALRVWELSGGKYFRLLYSDGTEFLVDCKGTRLWARWPDDSTLEDAATYLLGPVLGFLLLLRGTICLHGAAIKVNDKAIALVGVSGSGKSTTAAAFAGLGHPVLAEDVVTIDERPEGFFAYPGYPYIRLWPTSVNALYGDSDALPRIRPNWDKRYLDLLNNGLRYQETPLPIAAIYLLEVRSPERSAPVLRTIPSSEAFMKLVTNTYATNLMDKTMRAQEFALLHRLIGKVPVKEVTPHTDPVHLGKLCELILDDFDSLSHDVTRTRSMKVS